MDFTFAYIHSDYLTETFRPDYVEGHNYIDDMIEEVTDGRTLGLILDYYEASIDDYEAWLAANEDLAYGIQLGVEAALARDEELETYLKEHD